MQGMHPQLATLMVALETRERVRRATAGSRARDARPATPKPPKRARRRMGSRRTWRVFG
jgi:hypothetical protein